MSVLASLGRPSRAAASLAVLLACPAAAAMGRPVSEEIASPDYTLAWGLALFFGVATWALWKPGPGRRDAVALWGVKALCTLSFVLVFEAHYSGRLDSFSYYASSDPDIYRFSAESVDSGTHRMYFLTWMLQHVVGENYQAVRLVFSFIGFVGVVLAAKAFVAHWPALSRWRFVLVLGLLPSLLFWSSTLGKEPVMLLGIGVFLQGALVPRRAWQAVVLVVLGLALAALIRPWMALVLGVPLVVQVILIRTHGLRGRHPRATQIIVMALALSLLAAVSWFLASGGAARAMQVWERSATAAFGAGGSDTYARPFDTFAQMVAFWPAGAFTALVRPLPGDIVQPLGFGLLSSLDGLLIIALLLRTVRRAHPRDLRDPLVGGGLLAVGLWLVAYAYISAPNLGTAIRYRMQIEVILIPILLWLGRRRPAPPPTDVAGAEAVAPAPGDPGRPGAQAEGTGMP